MKFPQRVKGKTNEEIRAKNLPELKIITTQANWRTLIIRNKKKTSSNHRKSVMKGKIPKQPGGLHTNEWIQEWQQTSWKYCKPNDSEEHLYSTERSGKKEKNYQSSFYA